MPANYPTSQSTASLLRVRLTAHSTTISNIVLLGYHHLSDGAKLTYMVLESYDWPDENGLSKGKCWPSIETIAATRGKSYDTVARHLKELEKVGLIRIESGQEQGVPNCYWLLEPTTEETTLYHQRFTRSSASISTAQPITPQAEVKPEVTRPPQNCRAASRKIAGRRTQNQKSKYKERFESRSGYQKSDKAGEPVTKLGLPISLDGRFQSEFE